MNWKQKLSKIEPGDIALINNNLGEMYCIVYKIVKGIVHGWYDTNLINLKKDKIFRDGSNRYKLEDHTLVEKGFIEVKK